jgi:hypothetical protein
MAPAPDFTSNFNRRCNNGETARRVHCAESKTAPMQIDPDQRVHVLTL